MSGTSQAAAVASGIAALVLQAEPWRSVDELKCKMMSAAKPATYRDKGKDILAYSVFQQGAGMVDAYAAVMNQTIDCANNGLNLDNDIDGFQHFGGPANQQTDGTYFVRGELDTRQTGYVWDGSYADSSGYLWTDGGSVLTDGYVWTDGYLWTDGVGVNGYLWTDGGSAWTNGYLWTQGYLWTDGGAWTNALTEMTTMSSWVEQE